MPVSTPRLKPHLLFCNLASSDQPLSPVNSSPYGPDQVAWLGVSPTGASSVPYSHRFFRGLFVPSLYRGPDLNSVCNDQQPKCTSQSRRIPASRPSFATKLFSYLLIAPLNLDHQPSPSSSIETVDHFFPHYHCSGTFLFSGTLAATFYTVILFRLILTRENIFGLGTTCLDDRFFFFLFFLFLDHAWAWGAKNSRLFPTDFLKAKMDLLLR